MFDGLTVMDPPRHTRIRRLVMSAFTPRRIAQWQDTIERIVDSALDDAEQHARVDVVAGYATTVPSTVMTEILGFPLDRQEMVIKANEVVFSASPALMEERSLAVGNIVDYGRELIAEKRRRPADKRTHRQRRHGPARPSGPTKAPAEQTRPQRQGHRGIHAP